MCTPSSAAPIALASLSFAASAATFFVLASLNMGERRRHARLTVRNFAFFALDSHLPLTPCRSRASWARRFRVASVSLRLAGMDESG